jgi:signal transduction histidine kinase
VTLQGRLTATTGAVVALSLLIFSAALYAAVSRALWRQFDARLVNEAHAFAKMVEEQPTSPWEFEPGLPDEFERDQDPAYFELRMEDGTLLGASKALRGAPLDPRASLLPDGRPGRTYEAVLPPRPDAENPVPPSGHGVHVVIARATAEVDDTLATLRLLLFAAGLTTLLVAAFAGAFAVRRGLQPLTGLMRRLDALGAETLSERVASAGLPSELQPAVTKLNELLGRLEQAFARERRFSADVSHELRTPLAGLRSVIEVAASKRDRPAAGYVEALGDALGVVTQMQGLVENLLLLARAGARQIEVSRDPVPLRTLVAECFAPFAARAAARRLTFENRVGDDAVLASDAGKLRIVVSNLVGNAVDYTAEGGAVTVKSGLPGGVVLDVSDSGPPIPPAALETIFDPFVRLDPSRTGTAEHAGIGLSLVRSLCGALGLTVRAENLAGGQVAFLVERG